MTDEVDKHVQRKYEVIKKLSKGSYGIVYKARDRKAGHIVALKKIFDAFENATDAQRTFREIMYLQELNGAEHIIRLQNVLKAQNDIDIYLVFDFMDTDLDGVIRAKILEPNHRPFIMYQIMKAMKYLHSANIVHRDLKPGNVLLTEECLVKVADLGLARSLSAKNYAQDSPSELTDYVATRWYRAPELLMASTKYTLAVDIWAIGCILAEMVGGKPLFPGTSTINQIERIIQVTGKPNKAEVESLQSKYAQTMLDSMKIKTKRDLKSLYPNESAEGIDLISQCLAFDPSKRPTCDQILAHPYFKHYHNPSNEPTCDKVIHISIDDDDFYQLEVYRDKLYKEVVAKKKEQRRTFSFGGKRK